MQVAIETKHPTRYAGLVERRLVAMLKEFGWAGADSPARVMSFSVVALQRVQRLAPDLRLVMLVEKSRHWPVLKPMVEDHWIVGPGHRLAAAAPDLRAPTGRQRTRDPCLDGQHRATSGDLLDLGVRAVITDRPRFMMGLLDDRFG